ncbi:MAG TPA: type II secretion system secretin GspD [Kofleriaceae bacterium]|nr:type II secretion system secretin GspD [Kofleriaceae bacterium]
MKRKISQLAVVAVALAVASPAFAQPGGGSGSGTPPSGSSDEPIYVCKHATGPVAVNFKPESELKDLIAWAMGFTCKNFILDPRIVSTGKKVTVMAPAKMSPGDAYRLFLVALSTMGLTVVPKGNILRIVESATAKSETLPMMQKGIPPDDDQMVRYILHPSYAQTETLRAALDSVRSPAGSVQAAGNTIVITDYASQVRDMMSLAKTIDVPGNNEGIYTIPVKHADAQQLAQKINEILGLTGGPPGAGGQVNTRVPTAPRNGPAPAPAATSMSEEAGNAIPSKILTDERTNTLIVVSAEPGYERVKALVDRLDIVLDTEGGAGIRVYPLENALAKDLAQTLNNALQGRTSQQGAKPGQPGQPGQPAQPQPQPGQPGAVGEFGAMLEGQVRITNDDPTNSLIIMSTGRDYLAVKDVIRRLDQPRRQIFIEALILEVQLDKTLQLGSSEHGGLPVDNGSALVIGGVESANGPSSLNVASLASLSGLIGGVIGAPLTNSQTFLGTSIPSYAVLFQALVNHNNTNILSAPHIIAIDNEKAEFSVGNNIPYQAGLSFGGIGLPSTGTTGTTGSTGLPVGSIGQNIQRENLTLDLNVTPHISGTDSVRLELEQNTKDLGGKDPQLGPTWTERKLKTQVVVHDQESVVIGGLIQERDIYTASKVPLLGDIPILGYLFKYTTKEHKKTNLLILLTPYIIKDRLDLEQIRERKDREYQEFTASFSNLNAMKYEPQVDYRRKRGLVEEINRSLQSVEEDAEALGNAGKRQYVPEGPIDVHPSNIEAPPDNAGHGNGETPRSP